MRVLGVARFACQTALRSRRAIVTALLFAAVGAGVMYVTVSVFSTLESHLVSLLGLPATDETGSVTMTLWKSRQFVDIVSHIVGNSLVFNEIRGQHPIVLAYAGLMFAVVPMLTLIVSAPAAASEVRSGSVRYLLLRVSRNEWTFGLYLGEATVLLAAMLLMAVAAGTVTAWRLPGWTGAELLPALGGWALRAWAYAMCWLGVCLGASLLVKTPGKATALAMLLMMAFSVFKFVVRHYVPALDALLPQGFEMLLWRSSAPALLQGVVGALSVAFLWLGLGAAAFARRDV